MEVCEDVKLQLRHATNLVYTIVKPIEGGALSKYQTEQPILTMLFHLENL